MQELWEYDLMTKSVKFMQQRTSLSERDSSVCNQYLLQSPYLMKSDK